VAVIGGGVVGCAAAHFLAAAGASVELFERDEVASAASGRNSGVLQHPFDRPMAALHHETLRILGDLEGFELDPEPAGVLIVNAGHPEGQDELERVLSATIAEVFPHVLRDPIEPTNTLIVASQAPLSVRRLRDAVPRLAAGLRSTAMAAGRRLGAPLSGGSVYTDDRAPVEWLIDKSIVDYAAGE